MKKVCLFIFSLLQVCVTHAQTYTTDNSIIRKAIVLYSKDEKGFYQKKENLNVPQVKNIINNYAYDKKSHELYVETDDGNYVITVAETFAKVLKKNKSVPQLKDKELMEAIEITNAKLAAKFLKLNEKHQQDIAEAARKAKEDSIRQIREDSIRMSNYQRKAENYRKAHSWHFVPIGNTKLTCSLCDESISYKDSIFCAAVMRDTIYHVESKVLALGITYLKVHKYEIPMSLKNDEKFRYHYEIYGDSLRRDDLKLADDAQFFNYICLERGIDELKEKAPYGFFESWGWDSEYGSISFNFKYTNTNKNTIKYIDVYWTVTNDVNDVRKTGHFKGTGPLKEWETASWNWDNSSYYVAGDASNMKITKVIITYTNGSQKVLTRSLLRFN